jgi:hypothetical protein
MSNLVLFSWFFLSPSIYCFSRLCRGPHSSVFTTPVIFVPFSHSRIFSYYLVFHFHLNPFSIYRAISILPIYVQSNSTLQFNYLCTYDLYGLVRRPQIALAYRLVQFHRGPQNSSTPFILPLQLGPLASPPPLGRYFANKPNFWLIK